MAAHLPIALSAANDSDKTADGNNSGNPMIITIGNHGPPPPAEWFKFNFNTINPCCNFQLTGTHRWVKSLSDLRVFNASSEVTCATILME